MHGSLAELHRIVAALHGIFVSLTSLHRLRHPEIKGDQLTMNYA
jgi:hypothetical protein